MLLDISGPVTPDMWHYGPPYFPPRISRLPSPEWIDGTIYQQAISMPLQTGTYLETAAHVYPDRESVDEVPAERTVMLPSVCVQVDAGPRIGVDARAIASAVERVTELRALAGKGLVIGTGWSSHWAAADFLTDGPYFTPDAIELVVTARIGLFGADIPRFDDPLHPTGHLKRFFEGSALMLAPLYGLERVGDALGHLTAAPLRISGVCASPVRAIWMGE